ncbi:phage putative head morphogenesis protein, SPP1 gp7 family [Alkalibacterium subtropicum]|uniref:Phage putative head morphogenesis protein, SPP1 gp7 family n=1 Tax=Alkalibacterium subtropicum TaxID=753702 RepID=A0A1I1ETZ0_9LACT|nr:phage minor head protein [Alkalibacterium subtropicum]SFB90564.1 phage putative head morphogenesis protein, SPP1 gp7 family [Alkalibacterium subtropicum]
MQQLDKWHKELEQLSNRSYEELDNELFDFYKKALKELKVEIKQYIDNYDQLSFSKRLAVDSQLEVAKRIDEILWALESVKQPSITKHIKNEATLGYQGVFYALEGSENIQLDFNRLSESYIERLVDKKIAGKTLSKRLYEQRDQLAKTVTNELLNATTHRKSYADVAKNVGELTEASYKQALRIARTEGGRVQSTTKQKAYQAAEAKGVRMQKRWQATLDKKTRHQHQELDGQTVDINEKFIFNGHTADGPRLFGVAGLDINCRCTTISIVNGLSPSVRKDNETKKVIKYKNYKEWAEKKGV